MEATGVYWKPVWNVLESHFGLMLVAKKCDRRDAFHLADLPQHGLPQGSFLPTAEIRHLRDLTRNRTRTVQEAARVKSRVQKILEEANIKLASVATDVLGVSGRLILNEMVGGEQDATKLADLRWECCERSGKVDDHHRLMLKKLLKALKARETEIADDESDVRQQMEPFRAAQLAWMQIQALTR
jgi:hypothetical protein